ncbi:MAG: Patatin [Bacteroidetes bacterium]|nr:MAG: Patatin [Bacteroidota bacterium]
MITGISLSGGGARGIAHIGVLQALEENDIYPDVISGASAGAIVGAFYASGMRPSQIFQLVRKSSLLRLFSFGIPNRGITKLTYLKTLLDKNIKTEAFEGLDRKLIASISNLNTGLTEEVDTGPLYDVIVASASIPLVFQPVEINGQIYVDGGLLNNLPMNKLREAADFIMGVNVMPDIEVENDSIESTIGVATRSFQLSVIANTRPNFQHCDVLIEPEKVHPYHVFQLNKYKEIYEIGYEKTLALIPEIKDKLELRKKAFMQKVKE